jgi:DnaD/phage-associated family protein
MKGFPGFPEGKLRLTKIPSLFFSELLPDIDDLAELKVTLYAFWVFGQKEGHVRYLRLSDFLDDVQFIKGMGATPTIAAEAAIDGIERAVARGTFLHVSVESADGKIDLYEQNIGTLTPIIADQLRDAEKNYSLEWIVEAIEIAVANNVRKWRYVQSILERWQQEGKSSGISGRDSQKERRQQVPDEYRGIVKQ